MIISQNQARMTCNWVRMSPKDLLDFHMIKERDRVYTTLCCRAIAVFGGNFKHLNPGGGGGGGVLNRNFGEGVPLVLQKPDSVLN